MKRGLSFVLLAALSFAGCAARTKHVTDLPAGVTEKQAQDWDAAVANLHKIATVTSTLRQAVIDLNSHGLIARDRYIATLQSVGRIDEAQLAASKVLRAAPKNFGQPVKDQVAGYMKTIGDQVAALVNSGVAGIKNPGTQVNIGNLIGEAEQAALLVLQAATK